MQFSNYAELVKYVRKNKNKDIPYIEYAISCIGYQNVISKQILNRMHNLSIKENIKNTNYSLDFILDENFFFIISEGHPHKIYAAIENYKDFHSALIHQLFDMEEDVLIRCMDYFDTQNNKYIIEQMKLCIYSEESMFDFSIPLIIRMVKFITKNQVKNDDLIIAQQFSSNNTELLKFLLNKTNDDIIINNNFVFE